MLFLVSKNCWRMIPEQSCTQSSFPTKRGGKLLSFRNLFVDWHHFLSSGVDTVQGAWRQMLRGRKSC